MNNKFGNEEIAYAILEDIYKKRNKLNNISEEEMLMNYNKYLPEFWNTEYNIKDKINLIGEAIKENKNLTSLAEKYCQTKKAFNAFFSLIIFLVF